MKITDVDEVVGSVVAFNDELAVVERDGGYQLGWLRSGDPLPPQRRTYDTLGDALRAMAAELDERS
jgi:hypothetical protein